MSVILVAGGFVGLCALIVYLTCGRPRYVTTLTVGLVAVAMIVAGTAMFTAEQHAECAQKGGVQVSGTCIQRASVIP